jgi:hypothetical protein
MTHLRRGGLTPPSQTVWSIPKKQRATWVEQEDQVSAVNLLPNGELTVATDLVLTLPDRSAAHVTLTLVDPERINAALSTTLVDGEIVVSLATDGAGLITSTTTQVAGSINTAVGTLLTASGGATTAVAVSKTILPLSGVPTNWATLTYIYVDPGTTIDIRIWGAADGLEKWALIDGAEWTGLAESTYLSVDTSIFTQIYVEITAITGAADIDVGPAA